MIGVSCMDEVINILSTLGLTLFGALLSLFCTVISDKRKDKSMQLQNLRQEKIKIYRLIAEFIIIETKNCENKNLKIYERVSTEELVYRIEIDMQLFVSNDIQRIFHSANEAIETELPDKIIIDRLNKLGDAIRADLQTK